MPLSSILPSFLSSAATKSKAAEQKIFQEELSTICEHAADHNSGPIKGTSLKGLKADDFATRLTQISQEENGRGKLSKTDRKFLRKFQKPLTKLLPTNATEITETFKGVAKKVTQNAENFFSKALKNINKALSTLTKPFRYIYQQLKKIFNGDTSNKTTKAFKEAGPTVNIKEPKSRQGEQT